MALLDEPTDKFLAYRSTIFAAADLEGVGEFLAVGKLVQVLVDAMARVGVGMSTNRPRSSIINFDAALAGKLGQGCNSRC